MLLVESRDVQDTGIVICNCYQQYSVWQYNIGYVLDTKIKYQIWPFTQFLLTEMVILANQVNIKMVSNDFPWVKTLG